VHKINLIKTLVEFANKIKSSKELQNLFWLFFDKLIRIVLSIYFWSWLAKTFDQTLFGVLGFSLSLVTFFTPISNLGLKDIVIKKLVSEPLNASKTMWNSFVLLNFGSILSFVMITVTVLILFPDDRFTQLITIILASSLFIKFAEIAWFYFESEVKFRYIIKIQLTCFTLFIFLKILFTNIHHSLELIAFLTAFESFVVGAWSIYTLNKKGIRIRFEKTKLKNLILLLRESTPLLFSGIAIMIYMKIDQIMIGKIIGFEEVAVYTTALKFSEVWYFIPAVISATFYPKLIKIRKNRATKHYNQFLESMTNINVAISIIIAILTSFLSYHLISFLFGDEYMKSALILSIHIWAIIFVGIGVSGGNWFVLENKQEAYFLRTLAGAFFNIILNIMLIPYYGGVGAAISTVLSYSISAYFSDLFSKKTQTLFLIKTKAFNPLKIASSIKTLIK
jgi:PST family polysaccharide transporter